MKRHRRSRRNIRELGSLWRALINTTWLLGVIAFFGQHPQAAAQGTWSGSRPTGETGFNPSVALSGSTVIEVHNGAQEAGPLWFRVGQLNGSTIQWTGPSQPYDSGYNPSVTISGSTVIEFHNSSQDYGPLWHRVGQLDGSTIQWSGSRPTGEVGFNPSVAVFGSTIIEVHNLYGSESGAPLVTTPLMFRMGQLNGSTIQWNGPSQQYDSGYNPRIAAAGSTTIVEVHRGFGGAGPVPLWYRVGQIIGLTMNWVDASQQYDTGSNPSVTFDGFNVIEVHNASDGIGPQWYRVGQLGGIINWSASNQYDTGYNPKIAGSGSNIVEFHNGSEDPSAIGARLWYRPGIFPSIKIGATRTQTGVDICVAGRGFAQGYTTYLNYYGIPGGGQTGGGFTNASEGSFTIKDTQESSLIQCSSDQIQNSVGMIATEQDENGNPIAMGGGTMPGAYWCANTTVATDFNGGCR